MCATILGILASGKICHRQFMALIRFRATEILIRAQDLMDLALLWHLAQILPRRSGLASSSDDKVWDVAGQTGPGRVEMNAL